MGKQVLMQIIFLSVVPGPCTFQASVLLLSYMLTGLGFEVSEASPGGCHGSLRTLVPCPPTCCSTQLYTACAPSHALLPLRKWLTVSVP